MIKEVTGRRVGKILTVLITLLSVLLVGYIYWVRNDAGSSGIMYMLVSLSMMVVATITNIWSIVGLSKSRVRGRYSYRVVFAYVNMLTAISLGSVYWLFIEIHASIVVVFVSIVLISVLNLFLVRWVDLHRDLGRLSEWFILGDSVSVSVSGHRHVVLYVGVFIAATISGVCGWISVRDNDASEGLVTILTMIPLFIFGIVFTIMSLIILVDTCVGKLSIRDYRDHVARLGDGNGE